jgi:hypothetical protein
MTTDHGLIFRSWADAIEIVTPGDVADFLAASVHLYPGIVDWWRKKVVPGLTSGERMCQLALRNERLVGLALAKHGERAKLCCLRVDEAERARGGGKALLGVTLRALLHHGSKSVYYTIADEVHDQWGAFFARYGFALVNWEQNRYTHGSTELVFDAPNYVIANSPGMLMGGICDH